MNKAKVLILGSRVVAVPAARPGRIDGLAERTSLVLDAVEVA